MRKWGHDELQDDLAAHLRGNTDRMVWANMQMGPSGSPRPDVYTIDKGYSNFRPVAYECKVSVQDFRSDATSGKWQSYLKFSSAVVFAAPAGLLKPVDIPGTCGLILRHDEVWRYAKKPIYSPIATLERDAWLKLLIDGVNRTQYERRRHFASLWDAEQHLRKRVGVAVAECVREAISAEDKAEGIRQSIIALQDELNAKTREIARVETEQGAVMRRRLARALHWENDDTPLDQLMQNLEERVAGLLLALTADSEVLRLQGIITNMLNAALGSRHRDGGIDSAVWDPATGHVPYWWAAQQQQRLEKKNAKTDS